MERKIIGFTGHPASGKDEVVNYIVEKYGFEHFSTSDEVRYEATARGLDHARETLGRVGNELRQTYGPSILAERSLARAQGNVLISGIRNLAEIEYLKKQPVFVFLAIDAPIELRYERQKGRGRFGDDMTFEKFKEIEEKESEGNVTSQQVGPCIAAADATIMNSGSLAELREKVDRIMETVSA